MSTAVGERVKFVADTGRKLPAKVTDVRNINSGRIGIQIDGDPFPVEVDLQDLIEGRQIEMATKTARELRKEAKNAGIAGWEEMSKSELIEAIKTAEEAEEAESKPKKSKSKKSSSKSKSSKGKKSSSKSKSKKSSKTSSNGDNPFRPNTNLYHITEALQKGGKREDLIKDLKGTLEFNPRKQSEEDFDVEEEIDRRLKAVGYILKNQHGWDFEHEGRGREATIKVTPA